MEQIVFNKRELSGKKSKRLLANATVPAVVYNAKGDSTNIQITNKEAEYLVRTATSATIFDAKNGDAKLKVFVKEIDKNPRTDAVRHISFFEIDPNKEMTFTIPFNLVGIAPAVKNNLGVLVKALNAIELRGKIVDLISQIDIDITGLEHPGQTITVSDIKLPKGLELPNEEFLNSAIVTITHIQKIEEVAPAEELVDGEPVEGEESAEGAEGEKTEETGDKSE